MMNIPGPSFNTIYTQLNYDSGQTCNPINNDQQINLNFPKSELETAPIRTVPNFSLDAPTDIYVQNPFINHSNVSTETLGNELNTITLNTFDNAFSSPMNSFAAAASNTGQKANLLNGSTFVHNDSADMTCNDSESRRQSQSDGNDANVTGPELNCDLSNCSSSNTNGSTGSPGSSNNRSDNAAPLKPPNSIGSNKLCRVCGDRALGYNFGLITCESCKAFFRRNALRSKQFKCPFEGDCNVSPVTRRFCQKCRLARCFELGMRKEWILSDDQKRLKRQKIEQNRLKRLQRDGANSIDTAYLDGNGQNLFETGENESISQKTDNQPQSNVDSCPVNNLESHTSMSLKQMANLNLSCGDNEFNAPPSMAMNSIPIDRSFTDLNASQPKSSPFFATFSTNQSCTDDIWNPPNNNDNRAQISASQIINHNYTSFENHPNLNVPVNDNWLSTMPSSSALNASNVEKLPTNIIAMEHDSENCGNISSSSNQAEAATESTVTSQDYREKITWVNCISKSSRFVLSRSFSSFILSFNSNYKLFELYFEI